jgi:hypothetical protein
MAADETQEIGVNKPCVTSDLKENSFYFIRFY